MIDIVNAILLSAQSNCKLISWFDIYLKHFVLKKKKTHCICRVYNSLSVHLKCNYFLLVVLLVVITNLGWLVLSGTHDARFSQYMCKRLIGDTMYIHLVYIEGKYVGSREIKIIILTTLTWIVGNSEKRAATQRKALMINPTYAVCHTPPLSHSLSFSLYTFNTIELMSDSWKICTRYGTHTRLGEVMKLLFKRYVRTRIQIQT